jgi:hypothetical protein
MPALQLTLDYPLKIIKEPGFGRDLTAKQIASLAQPAADGAAPPALWADPLTNTVMLRPLQLRPDWLNTAQQHPFIVRLAQMHVSGVDLAAGAIMEQAAFGNADDPWIYHYPVGPGGAFPAAVRPLPGSAPSIVGFASPVGAGETDLVTVRPNVVFAPSLTIPPPPPAAPPAVTPIGGTGDGLYLVESTSFPPNQGFYLRWYQPPSRLGFPHTYIFYVAQFRLEVKESVIQVFEDSSAGGDRSSFRHVNTYLQQGVAGIPAVQEGVSANFMSLMSPQETGGQERSLLWLPFRQNQVLLMFTTPAGTKAALLQTQPTPNRTADGLIWNITRRDTLLVWALSPHWGRFQVQTLAFTTAPVTVNCPEIVLDYTPAVAPGTTLFADQDNTTSIGVAQTSPASYLLPVNNANDCPKIDASIPTYQARHYGHQLTFTGSSDGKWTPFFYDLQVASPTVFQDPTATPTTVADVSAGNTSTIVSATISAGKAPGEGRATVEVQDFTPYNLAGYYYRAGNPTQLTDGGTAVFTGITMPQEVTPLKQQSSTPRRITFTAADRWLQLTNYHLRDTRAWGGVGHIDVVQTIMQLAGIDTTGMETPPKNAMTNTKLGGGGTDAPAKAARDFQPPWIPNPPETAAAFIQRIAERFAGWEVGFKPDGTPYYRPRYYYTAAEVTLYENKAVATAAGFPNGLLFRNPVTFTTEEPEAIAILVKAASSQTGAPLWSSLWLDYAAIVTPTVKNYVGRFKSEVVELAGTYSCAEINRIAKKIWSFTRRRHITAHFVCSYSTLIQVGHCLQLGSYGLYRVQSYRATFTRGNWENMEVDAELVELGYGP